MNSSESVRFITGATAAGRCLLCTAVLAGLAAYSSLSQAAFILEIDTDGLDDGALSYNAGFGFGGDTTAASSSAASAAYGASGGDSIFGGDGMFEPDTYIYSYTPGTTPDNLVVPAGTDLGGGWLASGLVGGGAGTYRVYATWPFTTNVSGGDTRYTISTSGAPDLVVELDQNNLGDEWIFLGDISYTDLLAPITVTQQSQSNSFVSMRAYGLLFEQITPRSTIPEPTTFALFGLGLLALALRQRGRLRG